MAEQTPEQIRDAAERSWQGHNPGGKVVRVSTDEDGKVKKIEHKD